MLKLAMAMYPIPNFLYPDFTQLIKPFQRMMQLNFRGLSPQTKPNVDTPPRQILAVNLISVCRSTSAAVPCLYAEVKALRLSNTVIEFLKLPTEPFRDLSILRAAWESSLSLLRGRAVPTEHSLFVGEGIAFGKQEFCHGLTIPNPINWIKFPSWTYTMDTSQSWQL